MNIIEKHSVLQIVSNLASELNMETYVIGGYVRDMILNRTSKDIDIVVNGSGIELAKKLAHNTGSTLNVYKNFGTASVHYNDMEIEFVGARKESYRSNSRKPIVEDGTIQDDQNRRDFTINALAVSLFPYKPNEIIDPFNGLDDIQKRIIRTPLDPQITFTDDPLRMLRAIRFATQLNFEIEENTFLAINNSKERISIISKERITEELHKILLSDTPSKGFILLDKSNLLSLIFPELAALKGTETHNGKGHKDVFLHTLEVLDKIAKQTDNLWLRWTALLHDIGKPPSKKFDAKTGWTFHGH